MHTTIRELKPLAHAGKDVDPGWYRVHRRVSIYLTWALIRTGIRPNTLSVIMLGLGIVGAALLAARPASWNLVGFALLYFTFLLDKVDGEIARLTHTQSARGIL